MELIRPFAKIGKGDAALAGGKGASLGEMTQAGIPVPPGYVILSDAFERFIEETDLNIEIDAILTTVQTDNVETVEQASEKIQALILAAKMPDDIAKLVQEYFAELGAEFVAVRSSATAEDSAAAAWAGQLDTYLNTTEATLLENVQRCWASLFTPRAIFYRFEKGLHATKISVAVVVQKMVNSDAAGIAFSVHPVTEDYNQLIIEAGFGLGEAVVSGQVTPDSYVITKEPREILDKNISEQTRGIYRKEGGGNEWRDIPAAEAVGQVLTDEQIMALTETVIGIEKHYGFPVDTEWAMEAGTMYITQSRPITTLSTPTPENFNSAPPANARGASDSTIVVAIKKEDWYQDWSGLYTQVEASLDADAYFGEFERACGMNFSQALVTFIGKTAIGWLTTADAERIGTHLVAKLQDAEFRKEWVTKFRDFNDQVVAFAKLPQDEILARFDEYRVLYPMLAPYTIGTKIAFNMLPMGQDDVASELEELRRYTERVYKDTTLMTNELCRTIAERSGYPIDAVRTLTTSDIVEYGKNGALPDKALLDERAKAGAAYFVPGKNQLLSRADAENILASFKAGVMKDGALTGTTAHPGKARGVCRIVFDFRNAVLNEGDILVTPMTNPYFVPLMKKAGAIVTDGGGLLSHAAIVARELGKPCVIGTKLATQVFKDGDMIEVDADAGMVRILERGSNASALPDLSGYRYIGFYLSTPFNSDIWVHWNDPLLAGELGMSFPHDGFYYVKGGHFFINQKTLDDFKHALTDILENDPRRLTTVRDRAKQVFEKIRTAFEAGEEMLPASFQEVSTRGHELIFFWCLGWAWSVVLDDLLKQQAMEKGISETELNHYIRQPETPLLQQHQELFALRSLLEREQVSFAATLDASHILKVIESSEIASVAFETHRSKYAWIELLMFGGPLLSRERLVEQLVLLPEEDIAKDAHPIPHDHPLASYLEATEAIAYLNQAGAEYFAMYGAHVRPFLETFASDAGISLADLELLMPSEIGADSLVSSALRDKIAKRQNGNWCIWANEQHEVGIAEDSEFVDKLAEKYIPKQPKDINELSGDIGSKGIARGRVRIILTPADFKKMSTGDVLVTGMTTADFVVLMQKAAAIVTDQGGRLSHAAIISRELGKPCIIGTKFATQVFKDGDMVEVDADAGIVRKI